MSGEYIGWIRTYQLSYNNFCLVIKETCSLALSWWEIMNFPLTNSGCVFSNAAFSWSNWEQRINCLVFWKGAHNRGFPSNPSYIQHHLLWMKTGLWCGWWWFISLFLWPLVFHIIYSIHSLSPVTICFKNGTFNQKWQSETGTGVFLPLDVCGN